MAENNNRQNGAAGRPSWHQLLRVNNPNFHTHRTVDDITAELQIGPIERFLLWMSKTDYYVLAVSTFRTRQALSSLGMMVIFTTLLAFSSSLYTLMSTIMPPESPVRWPIGFLLASIYAFGILIIDREIVGAVTKKSLAIRLVFAICIATAVSWPVKLKFFEGRIENEVAQMVDERNFDEYNEIQNLEKEITLAVNLAREEVETRRNVVKKRIDSLDKEIAVLDAEIEREAGVVECGVKCQGFRNEKQELMEKRSLAANKLESIVEPTINVERQKERITQLREAIRHEHDISYDILTKWEALNRLGGKLGAEYQVISWFIFIFFLLLELVPMALKMTLGKTEYHYYIEARENLNSQKIISLANLFMRIIKENPEVALDLPPEISDIIASHMEDEAMPTANTPDLNSILRNSQSEDNPGRENDHGNAQNFSLNQGSQDIDQAGAENANLQRDDNRRPNGTPPTTDD